MPSHYPTLADIVLKLPIDPRFPVESVTASGLGLNETQIRFLQVHGEKFTAHEIAVLFAKSPSRVRRYYLGLGLTAAPDPRAFGNAVKLVRPPKIIGLRPAVIDGEGAIGKRVVPELRPHSGVSETLRSYKPTRADMDAGWWLNNAILHKMGLKKLGADGCSWIAGDPSVPGWSYCGKKRVSGRVYCEGHHHAALSPQQPKKENNDVTA